MEYMIDIPLVRRLMVEQGLSSAALAKKVGTQPKNISRYLTGRQIPRVGRVKEIAEALGVGPNELIVWDADSEGEMPHV